MKKMTYETQLTISFLIVILGCILSDIFNFWIYHSIAYVICGLLFIVHPVVPKHLEGIEKAVESIKRYFGDKKVSVLTGVMKDKDYNFIAGKLEYNFIR